MSLPPPGPYDAAASYRNFGQELLRMIQSGQITPERANQLKANVYAATRLGNTTQGQQAMNAAIGAARDALPMKGYDPAAMYRNIGSQLSNAVKSGQMTVQQAQALQAPLFAATKLGNTAPGYAQMNSAYNNAISAIRNASPAQPQGGLTQVQPQQIMVTPQRMPEEIVVTGQRMPEPPRMPEIVTPPPSPYPAQPPMALPGGTGYDEQGNMLRSNPDYLSGIGSLLANFGKGMGNAPTQPKFIGQHFTGDAPPPGKKYIETPEGLVPVPINDMPMKPAAGPGLGRALGMTMQPQGLTLSGPGVGKQLTLSNAPMQGAAPQPVSAPQGMAMGGLLRKYYGGGMC